MRRLRALVVDDEPIARQGLRKLLAAEPDVEVVGECGDGREAVDTIRAARPDLVLLDVQMPELDGIGVVRELANDELPGIVFVTAYDRYAIAAFDVHAVDYVLKPVSPRRFRTALERARRRLEGERREELVERVTRLLRDYGAPSPGPDRVLVRSGTRSYFVTLADVDWLEAADNYVYLHCGRARHAIRDTMKHLESWLPRRFVRIHRSAIVNLDRVAELRPLPSGDSTVILRDGTSLMLSRMYRPGFEERVGKAR
jgi:two-component system LytT family response regulator